MLSLYRRRVFNNANVRPLMKVFDRRNTFVSKATVVETQGCNVNFNGIIGLFLGGAYLYLDDRINENSVVKSLKNLVSIHAAEKFDDVPKNLNFIADVVERTSPAVVYIEITDSRRFDMYGSPFSLSNGSGFIVKSDGLILTNAHVVMNKPHSSIKVRLNDGSEFYGKVEAVDVKSDLATIRISKKGLPVLKLGTSGKVRPGEWVVAMGSPLSLSNTITVGIVSSVARPSKDLGLHNKDIDYIQTDAPITFGNSGGPLVNLLGEAIGINSMNVTPGISFAIPSDVAKLFLEKSLQSTENSKNQTSFQKATTRKYLGITMLSLDPQVVSALRQKYHNIDINLSHGVMVWKVVLDSPAHVGGLLPGDIITHVNQSPIKAAGDVYDALERFDELMLTVYRQHKKLQIHIVPEKF